MKNELNDYRQIREIKENLRTDGFTCIKNFINETTINQLESTLLSFYFLQAEKIGDYEKDILNIKNNCKTSFEKFSNLYQLLDDTDKEVLYQTQKYFPSSLKMRAFLDTNAVSLCSQLLNSDESRILVDGPSIFINKPSSERLLYKWHSEAHYYPKRRRFLNLWIPLFNEKTKENGTMSFKSGSHVRDFPFSEYKGFNKDSENKPFHWVQYEIPDYFLNSFKETYCETQPGDLVIFDRNLVHKSNLNRSDKYSVAMVARIWDPSDDLTISGTISVTPYGGDIGRSNLRVSTLTN